MKRVLSYTVLVILVSVSSVVVYSVLTGNDDTHPDRVIRTRLASGILAEERKLIIHLPLDFDSAKSYPVMYVLDGGSQDMHFASTLDVLASAGYAPKTIVVGIPNMTAQNREKNLTPPFMRRDNENAESELGEADKFLTFMEKEVFPFIEQKYPASPMRLLVGNSRGGLLVMYSLVYKPEMFQARFCFSTPFWRQDNILVSKVSNLLSSIDTLNTFIYMSAGQNETENIKNGLAVMAKTLQEKAPIGLTFYSDYTPHATHQDNAFLSAAKGIARWSESLKQKQKD